MIKENQYEIKEAGKLFKVVKKASKIGGLFKDSLGTYYDDNWNKMCDGKTDHICVLVAEY